MGCILLILDGISDRAYKSLGDRTPLQAANTPYLDELASRGANGLMHAWHSGQALTSENAHFTLFGYQHSDFPGRGYLEAIGAKIKLKPSDVAILARIVSARPDGYRLILEKNWPKATPDEVNTLIEEIASFKSNQMKIKFIPVSTTQGILVIEGRGSPYITDSNPITEGRALIEPQAWAKEKDNPWAVDTAMALKQYLLWSHQKLDTHPININRKKKGLLPLNAIATQRAGQHKEVESFHAKWDLKGISISSGIIYHGLSRFLGLEVYAVKDSENPGNDLFDRLKLALSLLSDYDFIHVHTKTPDEASHTKNVATKKSVIEKIDNGLGKIFDDLVADDNKLLVVTSDHSTPCSEPLIHSGEPVPIMAIGRDMRRDGIMHFNEIDCAGGALGFIHGKYFMYFILNALDRIKLSGLMDMPEDQPFWPGKEKPLNITDRL
ncbi:MAG: 2,3-bisphosphoglycerate-independent phosphoglycerate mutase [Dehalococcoidia bacterium]|nr:MAG: 2,3-bisphosphoglycerate-independent phosphoglycerate mutase [Dehalococcoidia bacterium]